MGVGSGEGALSHLKAPFERVNAPSRQRSQLTASEALLRDELPPLCPHLRSLCLHPARCSRSCPHVHRDSRNGWPERLQSPPAAQPAPLSSAMSSFMRSVAEQLEVPPSTPHLLHKAIATVHSTDCTTLRLCSTVSAARSMSAARPCHRSRAARRRTRRAVASSARWQRRRQGDDREGAGHSGAVDTEAEAADRRQWWRNWRGDCRRRTARQPHSSTHSARRLLQPQLSHAHRGPLLIHSHALLDAAVQPAGVAVSTPLGGARCHSFSSGGCAGAKRAQCAGAAAARGVGQSEEGSWRTEGLLSTRTPRRCCTHCPLLARRAHCHSVTRCPLRVCAGRLRARRPTGPASCSS